MHMSLATINCTAGAYAFGPSTVVENGSTTTLSAGTGLSWGCGPAYEGMRGYWTSLNGTYITVNDRSNSTILRSLNAAYGLYRQFPPGSYTVVAEDYWNQTVFAHFEVLAGHSSPSSAVSPSSCFLPVPGSARLANFWNSTFNGDNVTFANGTSVLLSLYSCPRPVLAGSGQAPDIYAMAVAAVDNSSFVAAENGSQFMLFEPGGLVCGVGNVEPCSMTLFFYSYGGNGTVGQCGGGNGPSPTHPIYRVDALATFASQALKVGSSSRMWEYFDTPLLLCPALGSGPLAPGSVWR